MTRVRHGMTGTKVYNAWLGMVDRCRNDRQGNYGKRGIRVCERWERSFEAFLSDMGQPPSDGHSVDRIDVNGHYEPGNCRWATRLQQARNTTKNTILDHAGKSLTIAEWAEQTGIKASTICVRIYDLGWTVARALTEPPQPQSGERPWLAQGISKSTWYRRRAGQ